MKTSPRTLIQTSVGIVVSGLFAAAALGGPGPQYWNRPASAPVSKPDPAPKTVAPAVRACTDSRVVSVTKTESILPNGRGPHRTFEVGKKLICTSCDTPTVVMKPSGHNGRGAMAPVTIKGTHDCGTGCAVVASLD